MRSPIKTSREKYSSVLGFHLVTRKIQSADADGAILDSLGTLYCEIYYRSPV
jgi:hypothetical protein